MSILDLWKALKDDVSQKSVHQIISFAGGGKLGDDSKTSKEFRELLSNLPSDYLEKYADDCLSESFTGSGFALQDIVNQIGERLGFEVEYGRYRGNVNDIGNDGLWVLPSGHSIIVEVKTTDAYRFSLDTIATYKKKLADIGKIEQDRSSILVVVGRSDTGDLEAQIRGSRYAWDMRLISVDYLVKLMNLRESMDDPGAIQRIYDILIPREFTKLDEIVDILFTAAEDVVSDEGDEEEDDVGSDKNQEESPDKKIKKKPKFTPVSFHSECVHEIQNHLNITLVKRTRSKYSTPDKLTAITCSVSKEHNRSGSRGYWFALHPHQREFLESAEKGYAAFGCGSERQIILIPINELTPFLDKTWITERDDTLYWHIRILKKSKGLILNLKKGVTNVNLKVYTIINEGS